MVYRSDNFSQIQSKPEEIKNLRSAAATGQSYAKQQSILRLADVLALTGLSRSSIYSFIKAGTFPDRINLGPRAVGWQSLVVDEWINSRTAVGKPAGSSRQVQTEVMK